MVTTPPTPFFVRGGGGGGGSGQLLHARSLPDRVDSL